MKVKEGQERKVEECRGRSRKEGRKRRKRSEGREGSEGRK